MNKNNLTLIILSMFSAVANSTPLDVINTQFSDTRIFHSDTDFIYGYASEEQNKNGSFFIFNSDLNELTLGDKKLTFNGRKFIKKATSGDDNFNKKVLSYFSKRYGLKYSEGGGGDVYVFLDYSCPFSQKFVQSGKLKNLAKQDKNIWIMPISRLGSVEGISNYSALTCMDSSNSGKLGRFMDWMQAGDANVSPSELRDSRCYYWLDLKPYYGIIERLKLNGVPSVVEVD